jgi:hypothetical protein
MNIRVYITEEKENSLCFLGVEKGEATDEYYSYRNKKFIQK